MNSNHHNNSLSLPNNNSLAGNNNKDKYNKKMDNLRNKMGFKNKILTTMNLFNNK